MQNVNHAARAGLDQHGLIADRRIFIVPVALGREAEWSDDPRYPEKWASLAYRIACNYFMYDLTH